ncbi:MAG: response regulator [Bacteroidota bacterium]
MKVTRFLFIDDSVMDNFYIEALIEIENLPIQAHFVQSVSDALHYLYDQNTDTFPEVIVSDFFMPGQDGDEFVREYEKEFKNSFPDTLVFLTSAVVRNEQIDLLQKGSCVQGFIEKPFMKGHLEETIMPLLFPTTLRAS